MTDKSTGGGWILYGRHAQETDMPEDWSKIACLSFPMGPQATIMACELEACLWDIAFTMALLGGDAVATENIKTLIALNVERFPELQLAELLR